jgi:hypothetical protein
MTSKIRSGRSTRGSMPSTSRSRAGSALPRRTPSSPCHQGLPRQASREVEACGVLRPGGHGGVRRVTRWCALRRRISAPRCASERDASVCVNAYNAVASAADVAVDELVVRRPGTQWVTQVPIVAGRCRLLLPGCWRLLQVFLLQALASAPGGTAMVRKGSPVRVRQRASETALQRGFFVSGAGRVTTSTDKGRGRRFEPDKGCRPSEPGTAPLDVVGRRGKSSARRAAG